MSLDAFLKTKLDGDGSPEELHDYTDAELADLLAGIAGFDAEAARAAGYSDDEILDFLASREAMREGVWRR